MGREHLRREPAAAGLQDPNPIEGPSSLETARSKILNNQAPYGKVIKPSKARTKTNHKTQKKSDDSGY